MNAHRLLTAALVLLLLSACSASNMAGQSASEDPDEGQFRSHNTLLYNRLRISDIKTRDRNDLLQVQATLTNQWNFELDFQYRIKWFDADGFAINPESQSWQQLVLAGSNEANVQGIAPDPSATRFEIWVRE